MHIGDGENGVVHAIDAEQRRGRLLFDHYTFRRVSTSTAFIGKHRVYHPRSSADAKDLYVKPVLLENFGLLSDERDGPGTVGFQMNEAKFREFVLSIGSVWKDCRETHQQKDKGDFSHLGIPL